MLNTDTPHVYVTSINDQAVIWCPQKIPYTIRVTLSGTHRSSSILYVQCRAMLMSDDNTNS